MPAESTRDDKASTQSKIDVISTQIQYIADTINELKEDMCAFEKKRAEEWVEYKVEHARVVDSLTTVSGRVSVLEVDTKTRFVVMEENLRKLERSVSPLVFSNKILVWIGGILGGSIIIFIWSIITHAVTIVTSGAPAP